MLALVFGLAGLLIVVLGLAWFALPRGDRRDAAGAELSLWGGQPDDDDDGDED